MRPILLVTVLAAATACSPKEGEPCGNEGRTTCGVAGDKDNALLLCKDGTYEKRGGCWDDDGCGSDSTGDNDLWCGNFPNQYGIGVKGTECEQNGSGVCDAEDDRRQLKCVDGTWEKNGTCGEDGLCGCTEFASIGCVKGTLTAD